MIYICKMQKKSMSCEISMGYDHSIDLSWVGFRQLIIASLKKIHPFFAQLESPSTHSDQLFGPPSCSQPGPTCPSNVSRVQVWQVCQLRQNLNFLILLELLEFSCCVSIAVHKQKISTKVFSSIWDNFLFQQELIHSCLNWWNIFGICGFVLFSDESHFLR